MSNPIAPLALQRSRGGNARRLVYQLLRQRIVSLQMRPGEALSENELAAQLQVSRTPVREALILLAEEGLVDVVPQAGTFVSRISLRSITTAQFLREAIETAGLPLAIDRGTPRDLRDLDDLLARQERAGHDDDTDAFFELDEAFHARLLQTAGHPGAWPVVAQAKAQLDRARRLSLPLVQRIDVLVNQHRQIVELVQEGQVEPATAALRDHLRLVFVDVQKIQAKHPELFIEN